MYESLAHTTAGRSLEEDEAGAPMETENGRDDEDPHVDRRSPLSAAIRVVTGNELSEEHVAASDPTEHVLTQFNLISRMPSADPRAPFGFILPLTNNIHTPASAPSVVRNPVTSATETAEHIVVPGWKKRNVGVEGPKTRTPPSDKSAIERRLMEMKDRSSVEIFEPVVGTNFDSCQEAYDFYNLYSWEHGFGIRRGKSRTNTNKYRSMCELMCQCGGKNKEQNASSCKTDCKAMVRLLRTKDHGWYVSTFVKEHNHRLSVGYEEKMQMVIVPGTSGQACCT